VYTPTRQALARVAAAIRARLESGGDDVRLEGIYAFGSRARGDHAGESDVDLLVVVGERTPEVERAVIDSCVAEELRSGVPFDPVIKNSASFALERRHHTPFYENIAREGIAV
jgi:predicted nucleotidyltransferase